MSKPRVLGERMRTGTEWLRAGAKVLGVEMCEGEEHGGKRTLALAAERCDRLYCDCGPGAGCNLQHVETKQVAHVLTYGFALATPRRPGRVASAGRGELLYYMAPLAEQQVKNSMGKYAMFTS